MVRKKGQSRIRDIKLPIDIPTAPMKVLCVYPNAPNPPLTHARNHATTHPHTHPATITLLGVRESARKDRFMSLLGGKEQGPGAEEHSVKR